MKRIIILFAILQLTIFSIHADDRKNGNHPLKRFPVGWGAGIAGQPEVFNRTSTLSFGFIVFHNERIDIRNQIGFSTGVMIMEDTGIKNYKMVFSDKISIGKMTENYLFRPYGFLECRLGTCGEEKYINFENDFICNLGIGFGIDLFATDHWSFFQEIGFLGNIYNKEFISQQRFELGVKVHFMRSAIVKQQS